MKKFQVSDLVIELDDDYIKYNSLRGYFERTAQRARILLEIEYDRAKSITDVIKNFPVQVAAYIESTADYCEKILYKNDIHIDIENLMKKYRYKIDYSNYFDEVLEKYATVLEQKSELYRYRDAQKNSRARWQGGGFGIKGALKGAAMAGVLNQSSNFINSFGDSINKKNDNKLIDKKMRSLYSDPATKACLVYGASSCIMAFFDILYNLLLQFERINSVNIDKDASQALFNQACRQEQDEKELVKKIMQSIYMFPYSEKYYLKVIDLVGKQNDYDQLLEMMRFFHLTREADIIKYQKLNMMITNYIEQVAKISDYSFNSLTMDRYRRINEVYRKVEERFGVEIPESNPYYEKFRTFLNDCIVEFGELPEELCRMEIEVEADTLVEGADPHELEYLSSIKSFMRYIFGELKEQGYKEFFLNIEVKGVTSTFEYVERKVLKQFSINDPEEIILVYDSTMFNSLKKGFVLSNLSMIDLSTGNRYLLRDISHMERNRNNLTLFDTGGRAFNINLNYSKERTNDLLELYVGSIIKYYGYPSQNFYYAIKKSRDAEDELKNFIDGALGEDEERVITSLTNLQRMLIEGNGIAGLAVVLILFLANSEEQLADIHDQLVEVLIESSNDYCITANWVLYRFYKNSDFVNSKKYLEEFLEYGFGERMEEFKFLKQINEKFEVLIPDEVEITEAQL